jgi:uracil-DNA glycosylase family protein
MTASPAPVDPAAALDTLREEAQGCEECDLFARATQTVFGEGPPDADLVLIGEQPGDKEDRQGHPFVGPAGTVLDRALGEAGIDRGRVYITNAVKHFKWRPAGKVRLHQKPNATQIRACRPWWEAELAIIQPRVLCCLGATAAQTVLGSKFRVTREHGTFHPRDDGILVTATIHPSAVLRADDEDRKDAFDMLAGDLRAVATKIG